MNNLVCSQVILAFSALCLSLETLLLAEIQLKPEPVLILIFLGTFGVYNLAFSGVNPVRCFKRNYFPLPIRVFLICIFMSIFLLFFLNAQAISIVLMSGILSFFYLYRMKVGFLVIEFRNVPLLKNIMLAFIWSLVTVLLPLSLYGRLDGFTGDDYLIFYRRFFFILAIAIPFDIRDYRSDMKNRLNTLPVRIGIGKTKWIALASLAFFILLTWYSPFQESGSEAFLSAPASALIISALVTGLIIGLSDAKRKKYFYTFLLDGTMIFQFLLIAIVYVEK